MRVRVEEGRANPFSADFGFETALVSSPADNPVENAMLIEFEHMLGGRPFPLRLDDLK